MCRPPSSTFIHRADFAVPVSFYHGAFLFDASSIDKHGWTMILGILPVANNYVISWDFDPFAMSLTILVDFTLVVKATR